LDGNDVTSNAETDSLTPPVRDPTGEARWRLALSEGQLFLLLAILIGIFAGLAVVSFRIAIEWSTLVMLGPSLHPPLPGVVVFPILTGLAASAVLFLAPAARGGGVHQTKIAVYIENGYIPFRTVVAKFAACALAIGGGHSLGPEDPSLQIGAGLASLFGRQLELSRESLRLLAPVGAAAGLAAAFNSPITAILFVIEEVIGTWSAGALGAIVLSAVSAVVVEQWFLGGEPLFRIPVYQLVHPSELLAYAALGVVGGFVAVAFVKLVLWMRPVLRRSTRTRVLQPAIAGLIVGTVGIWFPQVMGAGYGYMDQALHDQYTWQVLVALAALKVLMTAIDFSSGTPGGLFAPTLFIGSMVGAAVCGLERLFFPGATGPMSAYALVGMGTLFIGILRAPMTSVFMIVEISGDYSIVLPVMISNSLAYVISRRFQPDPIFEVLSEQDGVRLPSMEEARESRALLVEHAFRRPDVVLKGSDTVGDALGRLANVSDLAVPIALPGGTWGAVTRAELAAFEAAGHGSDSLATRVDGHRRLPTIHPDQPLDTALRLLRDQPLLPVVHRADDARLEGIVTLEDILEAYQHGHQQYE
jgi:CIC family chloride channel protein